MFKYTLEDELNRKWPRWHAWWNAKSSALQFDVNLGENKNLEEPGLDRYTSEKVRQAVVHTRQDLVLIVSLLDSTLYHLRSIRRLMMVLILILTAISLKLFLLFS
jgi:hypothetical protein